MALTQVTYSMILGAPINVLDYPTVQNGLDYAASTTVSGPPITPGGSPTTQRVLPRVEFGPNIYQYSTPLTSYYGQWWRGHGNAETADRLNTKLYPAQDTDGIRMIGNSYLGDSFHYGKFENFSVFGTGAQTPPTYYATFAAAIANLAVGEYFTCDEGTPNLFGSYQRTSGAPYYQVVNRGWYPYGWGLNWVSPDGATDVSIQGQTTLERLAFRNMGSGGIRIPRAALQFVSTDCNSLNSGAYGIYYKPRFGSSQQSVVFERFSADNSAGGAAIYIDTPQTGGHLSIRDLKSEGNLNQTFGARTTMTASCVGTALTTTGNPPLRRGSVVYAGTSPSLATFVGTVESGAGNSWVVNPGGTFGSQTMTFFYQLDQKNALVLNAPVPNATVSVDGLTHISAGTYFLGGTSAQTPGDAISITNAANTPDLLWNNVQIRTLAGQTITPPSDFTGGCVATIAAGAVTGISEGNTVGWTTAPTVTIAPPDTAGTTATATAVVTNGRLVFTIVTPGTGYTVAPVVTLSAPPAIVTDNTYGIRIESQFTTGRYSEKTRGDFSRSNNVYWCLGTVYDYMAPTGVEGPGWQLGGIAPGISLYAKNAPVDQRKVMLVNSSGDVSLRTVKDDGTPTVAWTVDNSAGVPSSFQINCTLQAYTDNAQSLGTAAMRWTYLHAYYARTHALTVGTLAAAATAGAGARAFVTDSSVAAAGNFGAVVAGGGANGVPVYSDGTNWRIG